MVYQSIAFTPMGNLHLIRVQLCNRLAIIGADKPLLWGIGITSKESQFDDNVRSERLRFNGDNLVSSCVSTVSVSA